jgi:N-acetylglutamate synthase-like GNAT family acetyltransferase
MIPSIRPGAPADLDVVDALLGDAGLPAAGVAQLVARGAVLVADDPVTGVIGCVALEPAGTEQVLVRSLAVAAGHRGEGIGQQLVVAAIDAVPPEREVWALTETAASFLARFGFEVAERAAVTGAVTETDLWTSACPASARALRLVRRVGVT